MNKLIAIFMFCAMFLGAQTTVQNAVLTWNDTQNAVGTTYSVYRASGTCAGTPTFVSRATGLTDKTYTDGPLQPGTYCYKVTGTAPSAVESSGITGSFIAPTFNITGLTLTLQVTINP